MSLRLRLGVWASGFAGNREKCGFDMGPLTMNCTKEQIESAIAERQAGNNPGEKFRPIFECYYERVIRYFKAQRILKAADCEDLTQDVFLRVYRHIGGFRNEASFTTWVLTIARNRFFDYLREQRLTNQAGHAKPESFNEEHEQLARDIVDLSLESNPREMILEKEFTKIYREALNSLPGQMCSCLLLRLEGYTYQQIADRLELNRGTVSKHLYDARAKIKAYLKRRYGGSLPDDL
jgi:RNA polymerase sigma-70 factor, ECF subfamily